jgi:hypothetical protein
MQPSIHLSVTRAQDYAKWLRGQIEAMINGELAHNPVLAMVCMLIAHAKGHPNGDFHRICLKRELLDSLGDSYVPSDIH